MSDGEFVISMAISLGFFSVGIAISIMVKYLADIRNELSKLAGRGQSGD